MMDYSGFGEERVKHLEMIQAVIARLASNSFLVKGWSITVAGAFSGFALTTREEWLAAVGILSLIFFWAMDTHFLRSERLFRALYEQVRSTDEELRPFFMGATSRAFVSRTRSLNSRPSTNAGSWRHTATSPTLVFFYGGLMAASGLVAAIASSLPSEVTMAARAASCLLGRAGLSDAIGHIL